MHTKNVAEYVGARKQYFASTPLLMQNSRHILNISQPSTSVGSFHVKASV